MRTIRIIEHISLDGVIQAPGGRKEDGDYPYGGWAAPFDDDAGGEAIVAGPDLIVWGSSSVTPLLLEHGLADEVLLLIYPVLLGTGKRLFSDKTPPRELTLVGSKAGSSGVIISTYKPRGPLRTGDIGGPRE
jgi:hypothetical protein